MARIRTVALGAALFAAAAGAVSAQTTQATPRADSAKHDMRKMDAGDRGARKMRAGGMRAHKEMMQHGRKGMRGPQGRGFGPGMPGRPGMMGRQGMPGMEFMRGLNLTETQRTQVRAIHEKYQPQMQKLHETARTEFEATRDARQRGDTAAVRAALQRSRQNIEAQASTLHEQMFREVRGVLTAEQRAKIDAQIAERIQRLDGDKARLERLRR